MYCIINSKLQGFSDQRHHFQIRLLTGQKLSGLGDLASRSHPQQGILQTMIFLEVQSP